MRIERSEKPVAPTDRARTRSCIPHRQLEERLRQLGAQPAGRAASLPAGRCGDATGRSSPGLSAAQPGYAQPHAGLRPAAARIWPATGGMTSSRRSPRPRRSCKSRRAPGRRGRAMPSIRTRTRRPRRAARTRWQQMPGSNDAVGVPGGPRPGRAARSRQYGPGGVRRCGPGGSAGLTTLPPSATSKDEFDLGIGYMQRRITARRRDDEEFSQKYRRTRWSRIRNTGSAKAISSASNIADAAETFLA